MALETSSSSVSIYDRNLQLVKTFTGFSGGLTFDPTRDVLYLANANTDEIVAFATGTWAELKRITIGENISSSTPFGNGVMATSDDGNWLFVSTPSGIRIFDNDTSSISIGDV